jgi:myosin heavy subunit
MREVAREALAVLRHEADVQMAHSQYRHFPSRAEEGAKAVILPAGGHNCMGCFTDQVKLTRALVQDLDEPIKEVKLLGEHEEELSQKIIELEALCKKLREDTERLEEEKATLEGMVESHDEMLMEIAREMGLDHTGEDENDEEEEEDTDDGGEAATPPATTPPPPTPPAVIPEEIDEEGPVEVTLEQ